MNHWSAKLIMQVILKKKVIKINFDTQVRFDNLFVILVSGVKMHTKFTFVLGLKKRQHKRI